MGWRWGNPPGCGQTHTCENSTFTNSSDAGSNEGKPIFLVFVFVVFQLQLEKREASTTFISAGFLLLARALVDPESGLNIETTNKIYILTHTLEVILLNYLNW